MKKRIARHSRGFSLVTVLSVTLLATLWLTATLANLMAVYRATSSSKFSGEIASYADSVAAFILQSLNDTSKTSPYDNKNNEPVAGLDWAPGEMVATATVTSANPTAKSFLFDGTSLNNLPTKPNQYGSNYSLMAPGYAWRIITAKVQFAGLTKLVQIIAGPPHLMTPGPNTPYGSPTGTSPFFSGALLSTGNMLLGSNFSSHGYDFVAKSPVYATDGTHRLGGDITSYAPVTLSGSNLFVGGSLTAMSVNTFNAPITAQAQTPESTTINRYVNTSGSVLGLNDGSGNFGSGPTNVLGLTNSSLQSQSQSIMTQQNAIVAQANNPIVPTPAAPVSAQSVNTIAPAAQPLQTGDYSAGGLTVLSSTSLATTGSTPTRIYLNNAASGAQINGAINSGGLPANFQIFYGGTGTIDLSGATINGTIYAPNANIVMSNTTVRGAIVAGTISGGVDANGNSLPTSNVRIVYDTSLSNANELKQSNALGLLNDANAIKTALNGPNGTGLWQLRYYSEQASLH